MTKEEVKAMIKTISDIASQFYDEYKEDGTFKSWYCLRSYKELCSARREMEMVIDAFNC